MSFSERLFNPPAIVKSAVAASATFIPLTVGVHEAQGQKVGTQITDTIADAKFPLKYGLSENAAAEDLKSFDFSKQMKGKSYVAVFGFNTCQKCAFIGKNLGQLRTYMDDHGKKDIPIVVFNTHPSNDQDNLARYAKEYQEVGVLKEGMYNRNFYILFPKDEKQAVAMQKAVGGIFNQADPKSHITKIIAVNPEGNCIWAEFGAVSAERNAELMNHAQDAIDQLPAPSKSKEKD